jgi:hypothetical protein
MIQEQIDWLQVYNTETGVELSLDEDTSLRVWIDPDSTELEIIVQAIASGVIAREDRARSTEHTTRQQTEETAQQIVDDMVYHHQRYGF